MLSSASCVCFNLDHNACCNVQLQWCQILSNRTLKLATTSETILRDFPWRPFKELSSTSPPSIAKKPLTNPTEAAHQPDGEGRRLPLIYELEDAKCEYCGMSEEYTPEYASRVWEKFSGKMVCELCAEALRMEMERNGGRSWEDTLDAHMSKCMRFNRIGWAYPVLYQAEAVRAILKKSSSGGARAAAIRGLSPSALETKADRRKRHHE